MFRIIRSIQMIREVREGYRNPEKFASGIPIAYIEGFFITSFIVLGAITGLSLFIGFFFDMLFFRIIGILFALFLIADILLYRFIVRSIERMTTNISNRFKKRSSSQSQGDTIDVAPYEHK